MFSSESFGRVRRAIEQGPEQGPESESNYTNQTNKTDMTDVDELAKLLRSVLQDKGTNLPEWKRLFNVIPHVIVEDRNDRPEMFEDSSELLTGFVPITVALAEGLEHSDKDAAYLMFYADGTANIDHAWDDEHDLEHLAEGNYSWREVYERILRHVDENLCVPELPE